VTDPTPAKPRRTAAAKAPTAKPSAAKAPAAKAPAAKTAAAKAAPAKAAPAKAAPAKAASVPPIVPAPVIVTPAAATAPAGWYPVPGSTQQRYWDGAAWTEHIHDPASAQVPAQRQGQPKAPDGTSPTTPWIWLTVGSLVISIVGYVFLGGFLSTFANLYANTGTAFSQLYSDPEYIAYTAIGWVAIAAAILFPILDWRALEKRGVPKPFHWAFSLFVLILGTPIVYVIGRTVVVRRRTGKGLAPLWVFIALQIICWIVFVVVIVIFIAALATEFATVFNDSNETF
jgi:hypothetical protein